MKSTVTVTRMAGKTMGREQRTKGAHHRVTWEQGQLQLSSGCDRGPLQRFEQGRMMGLQLKCQQKSSGCKLTIHLEYQGRSRETRRRILQKSRGYRWW